MNQIVAEAKNLAQAGDAVLLAPACASMDQFISYGDRGDRFAKSVREIVGKNDNAN
jgi:UDP-N-acetylmuramoylalanine--D-glutamate ligase